MIETRGCQGAAKAMVGDTWCWIIGRNSGENYDQSNQALQRPYTFARSVVLNLTRWSTRPRCVTTWNGTRWQPSTRAHSQCNPVPRAYQQARALLREEPRSNQLGDDTSGIVQLRLDLLLLLITRRHSPN